ncbi:MAG: class I SAM-dependent methyltransferase [Deltaproteobacteria bacterium]|nr:class I SAM-dependent methyltransferase [Deltaproteobacteria bacterium]
MHDSSWESLESQKRATFSSYLERLVVFKKTGRLLDVGCAFGALLRLATENGFEPYGIDVNPFAVDIAKRTIPNVYCTTIEDVPFPDQYFDVVVMTDTIEHIVNCSSTLSVANRKLAPGGVLLITTPDTGSLSRFLLGKHWPHYKMEHIYYFNRRNMKILLNTFDVLDIRRSHKQVSFRYFANVLRRYSTNPFFHKCYAPAHALSKVFGDMTFDIPMGEMLVIAKRKN